MQTCMLGSLGAMPRTVQIRHLDDDVYAGLQRRAGELGLSVPELLRAEATKLAARPTIKEWLARLPPAGSTDITRAQVLETLDELRGPWPDAGG